MTDAKALQLLSRFSLPPNSLGYCGQESAAQKFRGCVITGVCKDLKNEVPHFTVLYPYLKTIAKSVGLNIYDYSVIESYWLGNELLKKVNATDYMLLLENFSKQGIPNFLIEELKQKVPKAFIPNHLFQVLHVGVGRASNNIVPFNIDSINNCMIRWGKVQKIFNDSAEVCLYSLKQKDGSYKLIRLKKTIPFNTEFTPGLKIGDTVAVHWQQIVKILTKNEEKNLSIWTAAVLETV